MIYNLAHNGNKLITFTINGTTYQAIDGMTWAEWVDSEYNTGDYVIFNLYVGHRDRHGYSYVYYMNDYVRFTDLIIDNRAYISLAGGAGA